MKMKTLIKQKGTSQKMEMYTGNDMFQETETETLSIPSDFTDDLEKILYPQGKAYGDADGNHKRA